MKKGDTIYEKIVLSTILIFKMLIPPVLSLERLEKYCKAWIKKNPKAYFPRSFLADLYKFYEKNEEAKQEYMELKHLGYTMDSDVLGLGEVLFRLQDYQCVIETFAPIIDKYPKHKNANWCVGVSYMKIEEFHNAVVYLERVIVASSKRYENYWHLGYCYDCLGKLEKANEAYYKALAMKPDSNELRQNIASVHIRIGQSFLDTDLVHAESEFRKALEINPDNSDAIGKLENIRRIKEIDDVLKMAGDREERGKKEIEKEER